MKQDLVISIFAAVVGALVAYFVCGMFLPSFDDTSVSITNLASEESFVLDEPESEIFNYRSVNPTVEVWVGDCKSLSDNGTCNDDIVTDNNSNGQNNNQDEKQEEQDNDKEDENENQNLNEDGDNQNGTAD